MAMIVRHWGRSCREWNYLTNEAIPYVEANTMIARKFGGPTIHDSMKASHPSPRPTTVNIGTAMMPTPRQPKSSYEQIVPLATS
jgi:hypothetical protein